MNRFQRAYLSAVFLLVAVAVFGATASAAFARALQPEETGAPAADAVSQPDVLSDETPMTPMQKLTKHVPDPDVDRPRVMELLEQARKEGKTHDVEYMTSVLERADSIRREEQTHLTLEGVVRRALANNYMLEMASYNPAIETTRVVEAQAAFDAVFFSNLQKQKVDQPTAVELAARSADFLTWNTGVRKLLASGTEVSTRYELGRSKQEDFAFQVLNPAYTSKIILEMRQPLLRTFGLDFNRSMIVITKNDRRISDLAFRRQVQGLLTEVEARYWRLVQARRDIIITARLMADFEDIYDYLVARQAFDITPVQIAATKADLEAAKVDFVLRRANVLDAEDELIAIMNDPDINLADSVELIPRDLPLAERVVVDRLAEVQSALDNRTELREQQLRVSNAHVLVGRAKNLELPRFDLTFQTTYHGLGGNADSSFDEATTGNFIEYFIGVDLEVPVGNRARRAARRRAELQHEQAVAQLRQTFEDVILDVNLAVRRLETSYDQIAPAFESAEAREQEVRSIVARAERKDFNTLINELNSLRNLAGTRRAMLSALVDYNIALIDLERAKGTLLEYNNVVIPTEVE
jgi:outer membrane protein TolC